MIAINHVVMKETTNFGQLSQSWLLIIGKTTVTYVFVFEFLVVRVPTSSPTAADTHHSSKNIGEDWANATLLHVVSFLQASELSQTLHAGPGAQPPGSATAMLQTGCTTADVANLSIRSAHAAKPRITVVTPTTWHVNVGRGVYNFFPEFRLVDQYTRVLHWVQAPGGSLRTSRGKTICIHHDILTSTAKELKQGFAVLLTPTSKKNKFLFFKNGQQNRNTRYPFCVFMVMLWQLLCIRITVWQVIHGRLCSQPQMHTKKTLYH